MGRNRSVILLVRWPKVPPSTLQCSGSAVWFLAVAAAEFLILCGALLWVM